MTQTKFDDEDVTAVADSAFGRQLFNLYTLQRQSGLLFSERLTVMRRMLRTMLDAEDSTEPRL